MDLATENAIKAAQKATEDAMSKLATKQADPPKAAPLKLVEKAKKPTAKKPKAKPASKKPAPKAAPQKKAASTEKLCKRCHKVPPKTHGSMRCKACNAAVRKEQLKANNITWHKRLKAGKVGHRVIYNGKLTRWGKKGTQEVASYVKAKLKVEENGGRTAKNAALAKKLLGKKVA